MSSLLRRWRQRRAGERGAVLVEFAIIAPVLSLLIFGMIEYGLLFRDYLTVSNVTRTGARVGSASGNDQYSDYNILQAVKGAAGALPGGATSLQQIVVFKAAGTGSTPDLTTCSTNGTCNVYTGSQLSSLNSSQFGCGAGDLDVTWCPSTRVVSQSGSGTDYVGVWVKINHKFMTGFFGSARTITDSVVMRIEPKSA